MIKRFLSLILVCSLLITSSTTVYSQSLPSRVAVAVSGTLMKNFARLGFAANDPRIPATIAAVTSAANSSVYNVASAGGMVVAGLAGAPVWVTIAIGLGVGALAFGAYKLITPATGNPTFVVPNASNTGAGTGSVVMSTPGQSDQLYTGGKFSCGQADSYFCSNSKITYSLQNCDATICEVWAAAINRGANSDQNFSPAFQGQYYYLSNGNNSAVKAVITPYVPPIPPAPLDQVVPLIPGAALTTPVDPQSIADLANKLLTQAASQPGYNGLPQSLTQPVTSQDASDWGSANPSLSPTLADTIAPLPNGQITFPSPSTSSSPSTSPGTGSQPTSPSVTPSDPFAPPSLETTPTGSEILSPIFNLLPGFRAFTMPVHTSECPKPQLNIFGKQIVMDGHCTLLDDPNVRATLNALTIAMWSILAVLIILGA